MKYKWLNKQNNNKLIIFFNGLGMDEGVVKHLDCENYDVVMFYDYNTVETDFVLDKYKEKYLVAWSMGVMIATNFFTPSSALRAPSPAGGEGYNKATAINGTLKPIDSEYGIHPKIYDLTIKGFNSEKFISNMFDTREKLTPHPIPLLKERESKDQKSELIAIKNYSANEDFKYTRIIISDNDKIIPTKSQCKFWRQEANLHAGHCPFLGFKKWSELL